MSDFKDFYTLTEAVQRLRKLYGEEFNIDDIFISDSGRRLKVSVSIERTPAKRCDQPGVEGNSQEIRACIIGTNLILGNDVEMIEGEFELPMIGGEILDVERELQRINDDVTKEKRICWNGTYVERTNGQVYQIQESVENEFKKQDYLTEYLFIPAMKIHGIPDFSRDAKRLPKDRLEKFDSSIDLVKPYRLPREKLRYIHDIWRPAGCLPKKSKLMVRKNAINKLEAISIIEEYLDKERQATNKDKITESTIVKCKLTFKELNGQALREENDDLRIIGALVLLLTVKCEQPFRSKILLMKRIIEIPPKVNFNGEDFQSKVDGLSISTLEDRFPKKNEIDRESSCKIKSDLYIIDALYGLLRGKYPNYSLPFQDDGDLITALVEILSDKLEIDHKALIGRVNKAKRELKVAIGEAPEKAIRKLKGLLL